MLPGQQTVSGPSQHLHMILLLFLFFSNLHNISQINSYGPDKRKTWVKWLQHHHCTPLEAIIVTKWRSKQLEMMARMNKTSLVFYESCQEVLLVLLALTTGSFRSVAIILWHLNKKHDLQCRGAPRCPDMDDNPRSQSWETLPIIFSSTEVGKEQVNALSQK